MRQFLYFIAGIDATVRAQVVRAVPSLAYAFPHGESFSARGVAAGEFGAGVVCCSGNGEGLRFDPKTHHWNRIGDESSHAYLGVPKEAGELPGPDELARKDYCLDGHQVTLADGNAWTVPVVRFLDGNTQLPRVLTKREGQAAWVVRKEYDELFILANQIVDRLLREGDSTVDAETTLRFASLALGVNYRVGEEEVAALSIIDSLNVRSIANAALDGPNFEKLMEEYKKKVVASNAGQVSQTGVAA